MAKSIDKTHKKRMDRNCHIPDLVKGIFKCRKWWIKPGFIALTLSQIKINHRTFNACLI